jgi:DNA adenine methylase
LREFEDKFLPLEDDQRKEMFLGIRKEYNEEKFSSPGIRTSAKLIFLNRTCFNGLYRVNKRGLFNVPFGRYKNPRICNEKNLRQVAEILQTADVLCGDFTESEKYINQKSFVYFDPPYRPLNRTAYFTSYSKDSFTEEDQLELAEFCKKVNSKGAKFLLSNSDPKNEDPADHFFEDHYKQFTIERVQANRAINCNASGRGQINELLITNY